MKILGIVANWIFILFIPILLLTASIGWVVNSLWFYEYGFRKYDVSSTTGLADSELKKIATGLISYFNSGEEYISLTVTKDGQSFNLFTQQETIHFKDVKGLIWLDYRVLLGTMVYALGYALSSLLWQKSPRRLAWGIIGGSGLTLALMLVLGIGILLDFDQLLLKFHLLSFSNESWSAEGYQLLLFPKLLYDGALFIAIGTAAGAVILGGVAWGYLVFTRRRDISQVAAKNSVNK